MTMLSPAEAEAMYIANGYRQVSLGKLREELQLLGYRLEKLDRREVYITKYLSGPDAGKRWRAYVRPRLVERDTGRSFSHFEARRDANFSALQALRQEVFVRIGPAILNL